MMVLGGVAPGPGCVVDQFVRVFNLNTLVFEDDYNPEKQDKYKVPGVITAIIGGE
jgi:hypothetical protein